MTDVLVLVIGAIGSVATVGAVLYARKANSIAAAARRLAEEANRMSGRAEAREIERHYVRWDGQWAQPGVYVLTKVGDDEARDVKATVTVDGKPVTKTADLISGQEQPITFEFPAVAEAFLKAVQPQIYTLGRASGVRRGGRPTASHLVSERVEWATRQGSPRLHELEARATNFDEFCGGEG